MKHIIALLSLFAAASVIPANALPISKDVVITVSEVFVPANQSSQSNAYVIVSGMFPDSCYSWSHADITNVTAFEHEIKAIASVTQQMCLMVMIPYQKQIDLGQLQSGEHTLRFVNGDGTYFEKTLDIQ